MGGIRLLDEGEADDKIVAVLESDKVFDYAKELDQLPVAVVNRIVHYFGTYKMDMTGKTPNGIEIVDTYGAAHAHAVIEASLADYDEMFGGTRVNA